LQKSDLKEFINLISSKNLPNLVFVDNTSSEDVVAEYPLLFNNNISIVTVTKKGNSSSYGNTVSSKDWQKEQCEFLI
jgi:aspartokinase/homoserine dehydrogenase 1